MGNDKDNKNPENDTERGLMLRFAFTSAAISAMSTAACAATLASDLPAAAGTMLSTVFGAVAGAALGFGAATFIGRNAHRSCAGATLTAGLAFAFMGAVSGGMTAFASSLDNDMEENEPAIIELKFEPSEPKFD
jgi:hypothetical protein